MELLFGTLGSFAAIAAFAVLMECPKKYLPMAGIVGAAGGGVYLICLDFGASIVSASFFSAFAITLLSHMFARGFRAPVTIFLIPGILPTVPGAGMYRIVYYLVSGDRYKSGYYFVETLGVAGMIALAIFAAGSLFSLAMKLYKRRKKETVSQ